MTDKVGPRVGSLSQSRPLSLYIYMYFRLCYGTIKHSTVQYSTIKHSTVPPPTL